VSKSGRFVAETQQEKDNIEVFKYFWAAWERWPDHASHQEMISYMHEEDCNWLIEGQFISGYDRVSEAFKDWIPSVNLRYGPLRVVNAVALGPMIIAETVDTVTHDGKTGTSHNMNLIEIRDGKISQWFDRKHSFGEKA
jgi:hypothetical protein